MVHRESSISFLMGRFFFTRWWTEWTAQRFVSGVFCESQDANDDRAVGLPFLQGDPIRDAGAGGLAQPRPGIGTSERRRHRRQSGTGRDRSLRALLTYMQMKTTWIALR
jgi:hypothetical protein